jgi:hypothetical protein
MDLHTVPTLGMAFRMAFDLGLNLDGANLHLSQREQQIRRNVLSTCVIFDR